jgi:acetyl-CoA acetyltransferase
MAAGTQAMSRSAYVASVGVSAFGPQHDRPMLELCWDAIEDCLTGGDQRDIAAVFVGNVYARNGGAPRILHGAGLAGSPVFLLEAACASGSVAFAEAVWAVTAGRYETALAVGCEHLTSMFSGPITPQLGDLEGRSGMALPAIYAMAARRYLDCYGVTPSQLASVAVKNLNNAVRNPRSRRSVPVTLGDVLGSRLIADPLTRLQCCSLTDGAAAVLVTSAPGPVRVRGVSFLSGEAWTAASPSVWGFDLVARTALAAYQEAAVDIADIDFIEVHDAFTIGEIISIEALGLTGEGQGGAYVESGAADVGGKTPVNVSGGLLGLGHPLGATGLSQITEAFYQLTGHAGPRQLDRPKIALTETMGGGTSGLDGNACVVSVLEAVS